MAFYHVIRVHLKSGKHRDMPIDTLTGGPETWAASAEQCLNGFNTLLSAAGHGPNWLKFTHAERLENNVIFESSQIEFVELVAVNVAAD